MEKSPGYILVIGQPLQGLSQAQSPGRFHPLVVTTTPEQAVAKAQENHPYLVILSGDACQVWSPQVAREIRQSLQPKEVVIVALTESSELSWAPTKESTEIDGFFVNPLSADVLNALSESAMAKQRYLQSV